MPQDTAIQTPQIIRDDSNKKRLAVWQPYFRGGGAEAVALWILEALQDHYDVTLYTLTAVDLPRLNAMYNTQLSSDKVRVASLMPGWMRSPVYTLMTMSDPFRMSCVYKTIKRLKRDAWQYDGVFSAFNAVDMGRPGIQYIHWINVVENASETAKPWLKKLMQSVDFSYENLKQSLSLANSEWTASYIKEYYGIDAQVVFPPVITEIDTLPWSEKEDAFLCSGRIVKAKQPHKVIRMLKAVREQGFDVKLHITGGGGGNYEASYFRMIKKMVNQNADWIFLHQDLPYTDYLKIVARCRYGIHYKPEPFGISVAEMLKAGMIPFVRSQGGQVEIIGSKNTDLLFNDEAEGVHKIIQVLKNTQLQQSLLELLETRKSLFSTERFIFSIRSIVEKFLSQNTST